jgi:glycosyltransferase involved in cell wall biosynthesis
VTDAIRPRVVAVIAAFNEGPHIREVVTGTRPHVDAVLVVDDGSSDGTAAAAAAAGAEVVRHPSNRGKGVAVRSGLAAIRGRGFTHVLLMDGDLQHRPSDVPRLIEAAAAAGAGGDADVIVGARGFDRSQMPASRYWSNVIGSWALGGLVGVPIRDTQSGFRLIRLAALEPIALTSTGYEIETEMLIRLARRGAVVREVAVALAYDGAPSKLRPVRDTTRTCFLALYYRFLCRP